MSASKEKELALSKRYHSGELEFLRKERIKAGDPNWRILRYQRIIDPEKLPHPISNYRYVTPNTFEKHIKHYLKEYKILNLNQLLNNIKNNIEIKDKTIAISLDGGWVDNFIYAYPLLKDYQLPATFFLSTSVIGSNDIFWEDKVMIILLHLKNCELKIPTYDFFPDNIKQTILKVSPNLEISLEVIALFIIAIQCLPLKEKLITLFSLSELFNKNSGGYPDAPSFMSWEEVSQIERDGFTIGSMGNIPNFFSDLEINDIKVDVHQSFLILKNKLKSPAMMLALPDCISSNNSTKALENFHNFILGGELNIYDKNKDINSQIIPRVSIVESNSDTFEKLFLTIWNIHD